MTSQRDSLQCGGGGGGGAGGGWGVFVVSAHPGGDLQFWKCVSDRTSAPTDMQAHTCTCALIHKKHLMSRRIINELTQSLRGRRVSVRLMVGSQEK